MTVNIVGHVIISDLQQNCLHCVTCQLIKSPHLHIMLTKFDLLVDLTVKVVSFEEIHISSTLVKLDGNAQEDCFFEGGTRYHQVTKLSGFQLQVFA